MASNNKIYQSFLFTLNRELLKDFLSMFAIPLPNGVYRHKTAGEQHEIYFKVGSLGTIEIVDFKTKETQLIQKDIDEIVNLFIAKIKGDLDLYRTQGWLYA